MKLEKTQTSKEIQGWAGTNEEQVYCKTCQIVAKPVLMIERGGAYKKRIFLRVSCPECRVRIKGFDITALFGGPYAYPPT